MALSVAEYSRSRGIPEPTVRDAILRGCIMKTADGLLDPELADKQFAANINPAMARQLRKKRDPAADVAAGEKISRTRATRARCEAEQLDVSKLGKLSFADARALKENFDAKLKFNELQRQEGRLLDRQTVSDEIEKLYRIARDQLLNIPSRISAQLAGMTELSDIQDTLTCEIRGVLEDLGDRLQAIAEGNPQ